MNPSVLREILKLAECPDIISFAGGLPSPSTFPVDEVRAACNRILTRDRHSSLQYAPSEGYAPLREFLAAWLPWPVDPGSILITTGSQQAFDLLAKVLIDPGARILVESPSYLGALQAFQVMDADIVAIKGDAGGLSLDALRRNCRGAKALHIQPNFHNPTGRTMPLERRQQLGECLQSLGLAFIEDDPYGQLWFDGPPPPAMTAMFPEHGVYLGSFSKVLAPGLRLGFIVAPPAIYPKLLQAKQAADLHSSAFDQRVAYEVVKDGFLEGHIPRIRALYRLHRDCMLTEIESSMGGLGLEWNVPQGGMFLWLRLPAGMNSERLLPRAISEGVAFVPGTPFHIGHDEPRTLRLSFVNASPEQIRIGVGKLAKVITESLRVPAVH